MQDMSVLTAGEGNSQTCNVNDKTTQPLWWDDNVTMDQIASFLGSVIRIEPERTGSSW